MAAVICACCLIDGDIGESVDDESFGVIFLESLGDGV